MKKRLVALIMVMALALSLVPVGATGGGSKTDNGETAKSEQASKQIENSDGNTLYYDYENGSFASEGSTDFVKENNGGDTHHVEVSKTITPTGTENQFDINLQVQTTEAIETSTKQPDAAVVLVIDVSPSMEYCANCGKEKGHEQWCKERDKSRLDAAKEAAKAFLETYAGFEGETYTDPGAARYVSIVAYGGYAYTLVETMDLHGDSTQATQAQLTQLNQKIDGIDDTISSTNIDAGLKLAQDKLEEVSNIDNKFVVLLTDGEPNSSGNYLNGNGYVLPTDYPEEYKSHQQGYWWVDMRDYENPAKRAMYIQNKLSATFYSICFDTDDGVQKWMNSFSDKCVSADNASDLETAFEDIVFRLLLSVQAWRVTDPMAKYITYEGQTDSGHDKDAIDFNSQKKTLNWNLRADLLSDATKIVDKEDKPIDKDNYREGMECTITYSLTYRISLDVEEMVKDEVEFANNVSQYILTNGATYLQYSLSQKDESTGEIIYVRDDGSKIEDGNPMLTMYFKVPKVRGYVGNLEFTKIGSDTNEALAGATFALTGTDPDWSATYGPTEENGQVSFVNIPSGATYTLQETVTPEGYQEHGDIEITVAYGQVNASDNAFTVEKDGSRTLVNQANTGTVTINYVDKAGITIQTSAIKTGTIGTEYSFDISEDMSGDIPFIIEKDGTRYVFGDIQDDSAPLNGTYSSDAQSITAVYLLDSNQDNVPDEYQATVTYKIEGGTWETENANDIQKIFDLKQYNNITNQWEDVAPAPTLGDTIPTGMTPDGTHVMPGNWDTEIDSSTAVTGDATYTYSFTTAVPAVTVTKTVDKETVKVGETITYTITVENTGNQDLTNVEIMDTFDGSGTLDTSNLPEGVTYEDGKFTIATLAKEAEETITVTYVAQEADIDETITNSATSALDSNKEDDTAETTVTEADNPAISITKTASVNGEELQKGDTVDVGDTITYTLQVKNTGNTSFDTVTVSDSMWGEGKVETATMTYGDLINQEINVSSGSWKIAAWNASNKNFESGDVWTCTYTYTVQDGDTTIENTATVSTTEDGPGDSDTITIPVTGYDLSIDKVLTSVNGEPYQEGSKVRPGDVLTYTLTVTNKGDDPLENITVTDTLWGNGVSQIQVGAATIQLPENEDPTTYTISGPLVKDGEPWVCTYKYMVPQDATSVVNTATVDLPGDNDPDDTVTVEVEPDAPGLKVEKSLSQVNGSDYTGGKVSVGDKLTYTIQVTNTGNTTLSGVTVEDSLWNYEDAIQVDGELAYVADGGTYTIKYEIAPDDMVTITYTYIVLRSDAGDTLTNTATVTTDGGTTGEDTTETPVKPVTPIRPPVDPDKPELNTEDHYAYIVGYEDGSVQPEGDITRAEVATIFFRLLTDESRNEFWSQTNDYTDVPADAWYNNAVSTLSNAGIIDGYEDGTFKPDGNITRAEFATIAVRFFEATYDGEDLFSDIAGHWAQDYINEAANAGIVDGYPDGTFRPQQYITRAEAMTMVNRTIDRHPDADHLLDDMIVWPDNPETAWYYEQVQEATNSHEYTMNTDDEQNPYEIWTELLPNRDWSELEKEWSDANDGAGSGEVV